MAVFASLAAKLAPAPPAPDSTTALEVLRRRLATAGGAVLVGLAALMFAKGGDLAQRVFARFAGDHRLWVLALTPALFVVLAAITRWVVPQASGSGIPQVIAAARDPASEHSLRLMSLPTALAKLAMTTVALLGGASVGREGPTVQVSAAIMVKVHRWLRVPITSGVLIAGGAAGVAAAFNTPLAGIAFAIEELAVAYEQRVAVLVMAAVMISGLTSQGLAGDYTYFGRSTAPLPLLSVILAAPLAGLVGGLLGGVFSRGLLMLRGPKGPLRHAATKRPLVTALICGLIVAAAGIASGGETWGTGYGTTRLLVAGQSAGGWFGPAKLIATLATSASGIPGGIFSPSLAVGAGFGEWLTPLFPSSQAGAVILLGMAGYFTGVVRAPLTAVIILSEATGSTHAILSLFATALIGDWAGGLVCRERLYHGLSRAFVPKSAEPEPIAA